MHDTNAHQERGGKAQQNYDSVVSKQRGRDVQGDGAM